MIISLAMLQLATADCEKQSTSLDLEAALERAESAYSDLDVDAFNAAISDARGVVPCLKAELPRNQIAALHRFEGLAAFVERKPERSTVAFAASRVIEPAYSFPESLVPAGNPVLDDYQAVVADSSESVEVPYPLDGSIRIDGSSTNVRAADFPNFVQLVADDGSVTTSAYVWPGDDFPSYAPRPPGKGVPRSVKYENKLDPRIPLWAGAGACAVASLATYGLAWSSYDKRTDPESDLESLKSQNHTMVFSSAGAGACALGLGAAGLFTGSR